MGAFALPRRLVYVVDRRAVVDQATRFAECLRSNMPGELAEKLGRDTRVGLPISTLRGGFADNRDWLEDPSKPAIVVGTIDMVGSRLLFEGYGVSLVGMRSYHQVAATGPRCRPWKAFKVFDLSGWLNALLSTSRRTGLIIGIPRMVYPYPPQWRFNDGILARCSL